MSDPLPKLQLNRLIGRGYFGEVHEGLHPVHGRCAVKQLRRKAGEDEDAWKHRSRDLLNEGQRLKAAEHDRVVRVFDVTFDEAEDAVLLIMELCEGDSLQREFVRGPMSINHVRDRLNEIAFGLQAVHDRGMIHRDIKPGNILRDADGRAKLGDFGLVTDRIVLGYASDNGYVDHLAPEVFSAGVTSVRTDIWALGMTAYRLLHGEDFYCTLPAPRHLVEHGGFARRLPFLQHVPDRWRRFIRKLMHDDPTMRYQGAGQVLSALSRLPTENMWNCSWSPDQVTWHRPKNSRKQVVQLTLLSRRRASWSAYSEPISGAGRRRRLAGNSDIVPSYAKREVESFLQQ